LYFLSKTKRDISQRTTSGADEVIQATVEWQPVCKNIEIKLFARKLAARNSKLLFLAKKFARFFVI
jgi:hypothetical protein